MVGLSFLNTLRSEPKVDSYTKSDETLRVGPLTALRRVWVVYRCHRRCEKSVLEIVLELAGKRWLSKRAYSALLKWLRGDSHSIASTFNKVFDQSVSLEQALSRNTLLIRKVFESAGALWFIGSMRGVSRHGEKLPAKTLKLPATFSDECWLVFRACSVERS